MSIELGLKVRDKVTGFEGIAIGRCSYLTGCDQIGIVPPAKDGEAKNAFWCDEGRVEVVGRGVLPDEVAGETNGGPQDTPRAY